MKKYKIVHNKQRNVFTIFKKTFLFGWKLAVVEDSFGLQYYFEANESQLEDLKNIFLELEKYGGCKKHNESLAKRI